MGYHRRRLQGHPLLWEFPKMNAKQPIDNWYIWNVSDIFSPYALLSHHNVAHLGSTINSNLGETKFRQMRPVMSLVER